jgi:hypothetical protein
MLMAHIGYAPLKGKLCVAHIEMRHGHVFTNGVATVAHSICATYSLNWCAANSLFSTNVKLKFILNIRHVFYETQRPCTREQGGEAHMLPVADLHHAWLRTYGCGQATSLKAAT